MSSSKIDTLLTGFINEQTKNANFIIRLLNQLFTRREIKNMSGKEKKEKVQINNLSKIFTPSAETSTSVIETAANILLSSGKDKEINTILISDANTNEKVFQLLRLSPAISGKSRAYICLNNSSKEEFLKLMKTT